MAARIAEELRKLVSGDTRTELHPAEIDSIAQRLQNTSLCSLSLRRAIEKVAPAARVTDDFVENAAGHLRAVTAMG